MARVDRADIMDRFRNEFVRPAYGDAVVPLGLEHALLEIAGQEEQEGQADAEQYAQAQAQVEDDGEDAENREGIGNHADDAGIEEVFQGIDIVDEERCDSAGFMADEIRCRQFVETLAHGRAQAVGDFLAEDGNQRLFEGVDEAAAGIEGKVENACRQQGIGAERAADQAVDDVLQDEGRRDAHGDGRDDGCDEDHQEQAVLFQGLPENITHGGHLPGHAAGHRDSGRPDRMHIELRAWRRCWSRPR